MMQLLYTTPLQVANRISDCRPLSVPPGDAIMSRLRWMSMIGVDRILVEGARLIRPCLQLFPCRSIEGVDGAGEAVGRWGGVGDTLPTSGDWRHCLSVDCSWLHANGYDVQGCLSIYESLAGDATGPEWRAMCTPGAGLPAGGDGIPLVGQVVSSFPPLEALCLYGGPAVGDWLQSLGMPRNAYHHPAVYRSEVADLYITEYMKHSPLFLATDDPGRAVVVMGGWWHSAYLQRDYEHGGDTFLLLAVRGGEPWLEVWQDARGALHVEAAGGEPQLADSSPHLGQSVLRYG
jgi:hypothetical protein